MFAEPLHSPPLHLVSLLIHLVSIRPVGRLGAAERRIQEALQDADASAAVAATTSEEAEAARAEAAEAAQRAAAAEEEAHRARSATHAAQQATAEATAARDAAVGCGSADEPISAV